MKRSPFKLRGDGRMKDLALVRGMYDHFGDVAALDPRGGFGRPPSPVSARRTRSPQWRAGTRKQKARARR